jgi:hypothetical protein
MDVSITRQGSEFLVNTATLNTQEQPTITGLSGGGFVVSWTDHSGQGKGDQAFAFAGQNSSVVANSVTWYQSGGNTFVQADVNGNTTADFAVRLTGINLNLSASDFLL